MHLRSYLTGLRPSHFAAFCVAAFTAAGCSSTGILEGETPTRAVQRGTMTIDTAKSRAEADQQLLALGIKYRRVSDTDTEHGCEIKDGVEMSQIGDVKLTRPALLTQEMAVKLGRWVRDVLQPEARRTMGAQVASMDVYGTYSCRNIYGKPFGGRFAGRLSQHAYANAIDIGGFKFSNGREAEYVKHWRGPAAERGFLQTTSAKACDMFSTTLTPDYDRYHRNHIHLDMSPNKGETNKFCGMRGQFDPKAVPGFARYKAPVKKKPPVRRKGPTKKKKRA